MALKRFGDADAAKGIMASIKERSVSDEELGMFWRDTGAVLVVVPGADRNAGHDDRGVRRSDERRSRRSRTARSGCSSRSRRRTGRPPRPRPTRSTPCCCAARDLLASDALVEVTLGGQTIEPEKVEAGTGFYEQRFAARRDQAGSMGQITVKKIDEGVAWGSVHWQYLEDMSKVTPYEGTPLKLKKTALHEGEHEDRARCWSRSTARSRWATNWSCGSCCGPTATWSTST